MRRPQKKTAKVRTSPGFPHLLRPRRLLGTERLRTKPDASVYEACVSLPFGDGQNCAFPNGAASDGPLHFTGQPQDSETGLDDFGFRYYSAAGDGNSDLGRFLTPDPAGDFVADVANPQSWNQYAYVMNNPTNWIDPNGLETWTIGDCHYDTVAFSVDGQFQGFDTELLGCDSSNENNAGSSSGGGEAAPQIKIDCSQGAVPPPPAPPNADLTGNIQQIQADMDQAFQIDQSPSPYPGASGGAFEGSFLNWVNKVRTFGQWDYAHHFGQTYAAFGNFNYGATCNALGLPLAGCQRGAGAAAYGSAVYSEFRSIGHSPWTPGPGNPLGSPAISLSSGVADYGDQATPKENEAVIAGWIHQEWQRQCGR